MAPPRATYRFQFHKDFTFRDALALVPYLSELGISHLYASPIMEARPGSTHGYDIVDHNRLNPEIGSDDDFRALVAALRGRGMGLILDIVPNHMGIGSDNAWWLDVLEWGEASPHAAYFDIDWDAARPDLKGRVLLPVLGDQYGAILEAGEIALKFDPGEGSFSFWYFEHRFPISPASYRTILGSTASVLEAAGDELAAVQGAKRGAERKAAAALKRRLAQLAEQPQIAAAIERTVQAWAGTPDRPASFRPLHRLLDQQAYRLAYWRVAADEINYRRFFNINELAALRIEQPELFAETHRLIFALAERGDVDGLRVDHIDGLFDPAAYATALRERCPAPCYFVVEKILARYETLPDWPVDGSTGYDFVNQVLGLFVDPAAEGAMSRLYRRLAGRTADFDAVLAASKRRIMRVNLSSEMNVLARRLHRLSMSERRTRDFTFNGMLAALEEVIGAFPVYRTYVSQRGASDEDHRYIDWAIAVAKKQSRTADTSIFDFLQAVLKGAVPGHSHPADVLRTAMQFQQVTGPVMAKACEDTAFYRYFRLLALNEVGGDPRRFGLSPAGFHHLMRERAHRWPQAMSATATHDTKRGEDARVRLAMLSEMPRQWGQSVTRWLRHNRSRRSEVEGQAVPDRNVEYLFYQTLLGAWPPGLAPDDAEGVKALSARVLAYMTKAVREGKEESGWSNPNTAYEAALEKFVSSVLDASRPNAFLHHFHEVIAPLMRLGAISSLAQLVLKLTVPGVPDFYQGCELWDFSLVDPDNRRPPDWPLRRALLAEVAGNVCVPTGNALDGREKLFVAHRLLRLRQEHPALFADGDYIPLAVDGAAGDEHLCVFARQHEGAAVVVAAPRLVHRLYAGGEFAQWGETRLTLPEERDWQDVFTGHTYRRTVDVPASEVFSRFPVAVLFSSNG